MSNPIKKTVLKAIINAVVTELAFKTTGDQVYLDETTTASAKIAEMVKAINLRAKTEDLNSAIKTISDEIELLSKSEDVNALIKELSDELALKATSAELNTISDTLMAAVDTKADQSTVNDLNAKHTSDFLALTEEVNTLAKTEYVDGAVDSLRQEILGDTPVEAYNTFTEMAAYIAEHGNISEALTAAIGNKADQSKLEELAVLVDNKADQSDVDTLTSAVNTKADQSAVNDLSTVVNTKADQSDVNTLADIVGTKADQSEVDDISTQISNLATAVDTKADQSTVNDLSTVVNTKADQSEVDDIQAAVEEHTNQISDILEFSGSCADAGAVAELSEELKIMQSTGGKVGDNYIYRFWTDVHHAAVLTVDGGLTHANIYVFGDSNTFPFIFVIAGGEVISVGDPDISGAAIDASNNQVVLALQPWSGGTIISNQPLAITYASDDYSTIWASSTQKRVVFDSDIDSLFSANAQITDANTVMTTGVYGVPEEGVTNVRIVNGYLIVFKINDACILQFNTDWSASAVAFRSYWYGTWHDWHSYHIDGVNNTLSDHTTKLSKALYIESFDSSTGTLVTKSADYTG